MLSYAWKPGLIATEMTLPPISVIATVVSVNRVAQLILLYCTSMLQSPQEIDSVHLDLYYFF